MQPNCHCGGLAYMRITGRKYAVECLDCGLNTGDMSSHGEATGAWVRVLRGEVVESEGRERLCN